jgi:L-seryl-tRNA(Ser) seleniumtransferase
MPDALRAIPAVEKVLQALGPLDLPRPTLLAVVRRELAAWRQAPAVADFATVVAGVRAAFERLRASRLQPVINGTGVLLHTNLGRAPLGPAAVEALGALAAAYSNLEFDLATGERGGRAGYLEHNLALLCGADAATVVNNCAAALVLILRHFTAGARKQVVVSRGELIQIGGGFRIPEILESSGAVLREVGTTNRTTVADYARVIGRDTALILQVHRSNFFMGGFVESPATADLAALARKRRVPLVADLGSGAVFDTTGLGVDERAPTPAEALKRGADLVCFSGDKLLGGPQAGIITGRAKLVAALKRKPLFRALRCDKLCFAALQATVDELLAAQPDSPPPGRLPLVDMLRAPTETLHARAEALVTALAGLPVQASVGAGQGQVGGGTLPRAVTASVTLDLAPQQTSLAGFAARLRAASPPVIGYVAGGRLKLDLRTVFPWQDDLLARAITEACRGAGP